MTIAAVILVGVRALLSGLVQAALDPCASRTATLAGSSKARVWHVRSVSVACVCLQWLSWYRTPRVCTRCLLACEWEAAVDENVRVRWSPRSPQA